MVTKSNKNLRLLRENLIKKFGKGYENLINSQILSLSMQANDISKKVRLY